VSSSPPGVLPRAEQAAPDRPVTARTTRRRPVARLTRWISPVVLLVTWQVLTGSGVVSTQKLPSLGTIGAAAVEVAQNGQLGAGLVVSLQRMLVGLVLGGLAGLVLGVVAGLFRWTDTAIDPVLQMIRNVPLFALIPVFILWFGIGEMPKILLIALAAGLPLYVNVHAGVREADPQLVEVAAVLGYTPWQRLWHVMLPAAVPHTLVGVRLGVASAWLSLVVAEQINANAGIGFMIENARDFLRTDIVFVGLLIYAFVGLLMDSVVRLIERAMLRWRVS
jgi:sulfonate transport system permease protein